MTCNVTYDVLGNERHKAVCELRKLPDGYPSYSEFPFAKWYEDLSTALGICKGEVSCAKVRDTLIHLLGGDQVPVTLGDLYGISKEGDDGVDAGRRVETGGGRSDAVADGHMADCTGNLLAEGVAPITAELRRVMNHTTMAGVPLVEIGEYEFAHRCDEIDAVHAGLERENAELRERVAVLDKRDDSMHDGGSITDELREYAEAYEGSATHASLDLIADRIDAEHESACAEAYGNGVMSVPIALDESQWVKLPVDVDGEPIHIGDEMVLQHEVKEKPYVVQSFTWDGEDWYFTCDEGLFNVCGWMHHHAPTVEDVLRDFGVDIAHALDADPDATVPEAIIAEYAAKLRLAGDAE